MLEDENYITIMGWMVSILNLKGSELLVYALIYGFSQDNQSKFYGSRKYIADWFNCSLPTVDKALNSLLEKELIIKDTEIINGVIFNRYRASKETLQGIKKLYRGSKETLHNIIEYNNRELETENSIINNTTKDKDKKPTLDDIKNYINEKNLNVDAQQFYDYFEVGNWRDSKGNKVKNWKQKLLTWNRYTPQKTKKVLPSWYNQDIKDDNPNYLGDKDFDNFIKEFRDGNI